MYLSFIFTSFLIGLYVALTSKNKHFSSYFWGHRRDYQNLIQLSSLLAFETFYRVSLVWPGKYVLLKPEKMYCLALKCTSYFWILPNLNSEWKHCLLLSINFFPFFCNPVSENSCLLPNLFSKNNLSSQTLDQKLVVSFLI